MGNVEWIRITTDMFDNRKIRHLRKLPDGDKIVLIWIMLLCIAGKCNARGIIFLTENVPYTTKMLADELDFEENTVILALEALEKLGMIRHDGFLMIEDWESHQNVDGMEKIKAQNRERKRRQRERARLPENCAGDVSRDMSRDVTHLEEEIEEEYISPTNVGDCPEPDGSGARIVEGEKKRRKKPEPLSKDHNAYKAAKWLSKKIKKRMPERKDYTEEDLQRWARDIEKLHRIDGYEWELISDIMVFSQESKFWQTNILSGDALRRNFEKLMAQEGREDGSDN